MNNSTIPIPAGIGRWLPLFCRLATASTSQALFSGDFVYESNDPDTNTVTITGYIGTGGTVNIPATLDGKSVTSIRLRAFMQHNSITNVTISEGVASIGAAAFGHCDALTQVTIPDSVTTLFSQAFAWCQNLKGVYFKGGTPSGSGTFMFIGSYQSTVYYQGDTTGWETTYGGRPTQRWDPSILTDGGSFGVTNNTFAFNIAGSSNELVKVEACTSLVAGIWEPIVTSSLSNGAVYFSDPDYTNHPSRFYQLEMP